MSQCLVRHAMHALSYGDVMFILSSLCLLLHAVPVAFLLSSCCGLLRWWDRYCFLCRLPCCCILQYRPPSCCLLPVAYCAGGLAIAFCAGCLVVARSVERFAAPVGLLWPCDPVGSLCHTAAFCTGAFITRILRKLQCCTGLYVYS